MSGQEILEDEAWADDSDEGGERCMACDAELDLNDRNPCDDCTGLRGCADDICHGIGYCMHDSNAWIP